MLTLTSQTLSLLFPPPTTISLAPRVHAAPSPPSLLLPIVAHPQVFKDATLFFSRGSPNIAAVIPAMDLIDTRLGDVARESNDTFDPAIRTAAGIAKRTLNRYYKISDMSSTYRIAVGESQFTCALPRHQLPRTPVLQPKHKMRYFERAGWPKHWIKEALSMVRDEYDRHYRHLDERVAAERTSTDDEDVEDEDDGDDINHEGTASSSQARSNCGPRASQKKGSAIDEVCHLRLCERYEAYADCLSSGRQPLRPHGG